MDRNLSQEEILRQVVAFADKAHGAQTRKYVPDRYIVHPVRVMERCRQHTRNTNILAAAVLHDVLEDTATSPGAILEFLKGLLPLPDAIRTVRLVEELTDVYTSQRYPGWNRAGENRWNRNASPKQALKPRRSNMRISSIMPRRYYGMTGTLAENSCRNAGIF